MTFTDSTANVMRWNDYFKYKRRLVWFKRFAGGVPATFAFLAAEGAVLSLPIFDPSRPILGMDPLVIAGASTVIGLVGSFFTGSAVAGLAWRILRPKLAVQMDAHQKRFYAKISKYRANVPPNPTQMNFSFDFYGEKIASVKDYRHWLRRQKEMIRERKFNL